MQPGKYTISIRAVGYILDGPKSVEIPAGGNATADLKLNRARNIHLQLSNAEWLASLPGTDRDKQFLTNCTGCHTLQRIFSAQRNDAEEWIQVFNRMGRYYPGSTPAQPQLLVSGGPRSDRGRVDPDIAKAAAQFLVNVSLTNPDAKEYEFKPLPRPKGRATRVIITEYDLPRKNAYPHDVVVDADGHAWYSDFGSQVMGVLDPKTGKVTDYDIPVVRAEQPKGTLDLQLDRDGNLWIAMMYQSAIAKMDRQTQEADGLSVSKGVARLQHPGVDGGAAELARRRQGVVEQSGDPRILPARRRHRDIREHRQGGRQEWPADQRLRHSDRPRQQHVPARVQRYEHRAA